MTTIAQQNNQSAETLAATRKASEEEIARLLSGIDVSKIKLNVNRGARRFAVIADINGKILKEIDPDDGEERQVKLLGDQTWQFVDAIAAKMKLPNAAKFIAWKWNIATSAYELDRSKFDKDGKQIGEEGVMDHYVRRYSFKATRAALMLPGMAELSIMSKAATEIAKEIKTAKGKLPSDAKKRMLMHFISFLKSTGTDRAECVKLLKEGWPELFEKHEAK